MGERWTAERIPGQAGRSAIVTGANSGIGFVTARELARAGADVLLACRDAERGEAAAATIRAAVPDASVSVAALDLASLDSVRAFAQTFLAERAGLDLLVNNAGVMAPPREETGDGFELQLGTNHLGHFALTALLLDALEGREGSRVVTVASNRHKTARIDFGDLQGERCYRRWRAYGQSKLANLLFALELDRRLRASESTIRSLAAHPGYAATALMRGSPPARAVFAAGTRLWGQSAAMGALPLLYAATADLPGGTYVGPGGRGEWRGDPALVLPSPTARDREVAKRLWQVSEELTGVRCEVPAAA
jgi:NAD(P)-dependent dehydrogenase (short-subunit alcohol dehydrogenase family)